VHQLLRLLATPYIDCIFVRLIFLTPQLIPFVPGERAVGNRLRKLALLPEALDCQSPSLLFLLLQGLFERTPAFQSRLNTLAMSRADFIACGGSAVRTFGANTF
jgi:hypothetical protein